MPQTCTRCENTGFLNLDQVDNTALKIFDELGDTDVIEAWIEQNSNHDVQVCDCCGDAYGWYDEPGWHYNSKDPPGESGPYAYNGGLCECN